MKNKLNSLILVSFVLISAISCDQLPELPVEPKITFNDVIFIPGGALGNLTNSDTLLVKIDFEDGDGNLGIGEDDRTDTLFQEFYFITYTNHRIARFDPNRVVRFGDDGQPDYNIDDWFVGFVDNDDIVDTVRVEYNKNFHNFFIDFYYRSDVNGDGDIEDPEDYIKINIAELFGGRSGFGFNGRFFLLNTSPDERPLRGTLEYEMISPFSINPIFRDNILRVDVKIRDRDFNESNTVSSHDFQLYE